jgi:replication factor C small subunit
MTNWNELYRPNSLDDCIGQSHIIPKLKAQVERIQQGNDGAMPHLFFSGPPGVGKTSTAVAFLKDCFGEAWEDNVLITNASDERKLEDIRTKVKSFAELGVTGSYITKDGVERPIPFKAIILDEADYLDALAQPPLRRIMEEFANVTRFIICCNYPHKIISPIRDRCVIFRFKPLKAKQAIQMLDRIIEQNQLELDDDTRKHLGILAHGSARKAQNILYSASLGKTKITKKDIHLAAGKLDKRFPKKVFVHLLDDGVGYQEKYDLIDNNVDDLINEGASSEEILEVFYDYIAELGSIPPTVKGELFYMLGETMFRCSQVENAPLQVKIFLRQMLGVIKR